MLLDTPASEMDIPFQSDVRSSRRVKEGSAPRQMISSMKTRVGRVMVLSAFLWSREEW
jgi:hypothetical protein